MFVGSLDAVNKTENQEKSVKILIVSANIGCRKVPIKFKLDISAILCPCLSTNTRKRLTEQKKTLTAYNNQEIKVVGEIKLPVYINEKHGVVDFMVVGEKCVTTGT